MPNELKKLQNTSYKAFDFCAFARYKQKDSSLKQRVSFSTHTLVFVKNGSKIMHSANEDFILNEGQMLFVKQGDYCLSNVSAKNGIYEAYLFFFDNAFLFALIQKYGIDLNEFAKDTQPLFLQSDTLLEAILQSFAPLFEPNIYYDESLVSLKFEEIFLHLYTNKNKAFLGFLHEIANEEKLRLSFLFKNNSKIFLDLDEMASCAKMKKSDFAKNFKQSFGINPKKYLDLQRLERAKFLLKNSDKNINEIASECNFASVSWFCKRFKELYKQSPKQFQKSANS